MFINNIKQRQNFNFLNKKMFMGFLLFFNVSGFLLFFNVSGFLYLFFEYFVFFI